MTFACTPDFSTDRFKSLAGLEQLASEVMWTFVPIWFAVLVGLILGWSWKPRWATLLVVALRSRPRLAWSVPPGFGARRLWLAATAASAAPVLRQTLERARAWLVGILASWREMQDRIKAFNPEEAAACSPFGVLTNRARRVLLKEAVSSASTASTATSRISTSSAISARVDGSSLTSFPADSTSSDRLFRPTALNCAPSLLALDVPRSASGQLTSRRSRPAAVKVPVQAHMESLLKTHPSAFAAGQGSSEGSRQSCLSLSFSPGSTSESPVSPSRCAHGESCPHGQVLTEADLEDFLEKLEEGTERGCQRWGLLMEKKTNRMAYTAWRRDPQNGATEYKFRMVIRDCAPETMRDFFWDDDFRPEWDSMLSQWRTLEDCSDTGLQVVRWVRKFPVFCKDREYIIARRIWSKDGVYFCITKGLPEHPEVPRKSDPRRIDQFYSCWRIQALENGECEVITYHQEDMGIQRDLAKLGIRQGMWGLVKRIEPGVRQFRRSLSERESSGVLNKSLSMARLHTPLPALTPSPSLHGLLGASTPRLRSARRWVSSADLTRVSSSNSCADADDDSVVGQELSTGEMGGAGNALRCGSPQASEVVEEEKGEREEEEEREEEAVLPGGMAPGSSQSFVSFREEDGCPEDTEAVAGQGKEEATGSKQGSRGREVSKLEGSKQLRLLVAGSVVAFVCGVEAGLLVKIALAAAVRQALLSRGRSRR